MTQKTMTNGFSIQFLFAVRAERACCGRAPMNSFSFKNSASFGCLEDPIISEVNRFQRVRSNLRLDDSLVLQFGVMAKVNEKTKLKPASFQVVRTCARCSSASSVTAFSS